MFNGSRSNSEAYVSYMELIDHVNRVFAKITLNRFIVSDCMDGIIHKIYSTYQQYSMFVISTKVEAFGQAKHAVDTAILAAAIAGKKDFSISDTYVLIESALLHDVGMLCIPQEILNKQGSLSRAEYWYILTHPIQSYKLISKELACAQDVSQIVLQHHENWNGEGYPKRLAGADIQLEARIIAVADAFCAMISARSYRSSLGGHQAMRNLLADNTARFDPDVLEIFLHVMGIYPIGSLVELNNGAIAQVIAYDESIPLLKPRICLLANPAGDQYEEEETLDLSCEKGLFVKRAVDSWESPEAPI